MNGFHFWFYQIDDPQHLLNVVTSKLAANEWTTVSKLGEVVRLHSEMDLIVCGKAL